MKFSTLGHACHHYAHVTLALRHDRRYRLPEFPSTSFMEIGHARPHSYPTEGQINAWDSNAGRTDYQLENKATVAALLAELRRALALLSQWVRDGEWLARAVNDICVRGRWKYEVGRGGRHIGTATERFMRTLGIADERTVQRWLELGWEFIGLCANIAPAGKKENAIAQRAVNVDALDWLRGRGVLLSERSRG